MSKKRVLIISYPYDTHARAIAYAIRAKGHICEELFCADYPSLTTISLKASNKTGSHGSIIHQDNSGFEITNDAFDTIWLRRRREPWLPTSMHPGDREVALRQCDCSLSDLIAALDGPSVFLVNHFEREHATNLKLYQLRQAVRAGLTIPETLINNSPEEIREFIARCGGTAIHKLQRNAAWKSKEDEDEDEH